MKIAITPPMNADNLSALLLFPSAPLTWVSFLFLSVFVVPETEVGLATLPPTAVGIEAPLVALGAVHC